MATSFPKFLFELLAVSMLSLSIWFRLGVLRAALAVLAMQFFGSSLLVHAQELASQSEGGTKSKTATSSKALEGTKVVGHEDYKLEDVEGWQVFVHHELLEKEAKLTKQAIGLLAGQLKTIKKVVPDEAVIQLQAVRLWFSPPYEGVRPSAEYHGNVNWLLNNGRIRELAKSVEFTNVKNFKRECVRMPMLALHELAHAYHDQVLGFGQDEVVQAFKAAKASGNYDSVERWFGPHRENTTEIAYAMSNHKEYFAETSEALFGRNDFFPFTVEQLKRHDPKMFQLLDRLWSKPPKE